MDKSSERLNLKWLRQYAYLGRRWIALSVFAGSFNALLIIFQAWILAALLHGLIIEQQPIEQFFTHLIALITIAPLRGIAVWLKERFGFKAGEAVRSHIRQQLLDRFAELGPAYIQQRAAGSWTTLLSEQVEKLQHYYSHYLVQTKLAMIIPIAIVAMVAPTNWAAVVIFCVTAPLTIVFIAFVGMGAADANKRNFLALERLSGHFLDRLTGLATIRHFDKVDAETNKMARASELFRQRTMEVLRIAFLSSAVLEFFASVSIAVIAVYFGFSYLGELDFGHYDRGVSLFSGLLILFLAPEFFQPLRDLGTHYHAKAEAIGAADQLNQFLNQRSQINDGTITPEVDDGVELQATNLQVCALDGTPLMAPVNFTLAAGAAIAIAGVTGSGKTSLLHGIMGSLPYQGSLTLNGVEIRDIEPEQLLQQITWLGQNPLLLTASIRENLCLAGNFDDAELWQALALANAAEFVQSLPGQLDYQIADGGAGLSVGQCQRIALARALLKPAPLLLLDEPTASLDRESEAVIEQALAQFQQQRTTVTVSHRSNQIARADSVVTLKSLKNDSEVADA